LLVPYRLPQFLDVAFDRGNLISQRLVDGEENQHIQSHYDQADRFNDSVYDLASTLPHVRALLPSLTSDFRL
jgi:hypothetical protein